MGYDFGLIGLGVMGRNFALNVAENGFSVAGLDSDPSQAQTFEQEGSAFTVKGFSDTSGFLAALDRPRKIMFLVPAGKAVDQVIDSLLPDLDEGDILIDGGNSYFPDTNRRFAELKRKGIRYMGMGVSGGAEGARKGPSMMPGGEESTYALVRDILEAAAAKVEGEPCVDYMGKDSAGNYVKMVHNGIEYALMQSIAEIYDVFRTVGFDNERIADIFKEWNNGRLNSFLLEITHHILRNKEGDEYIVDLILDRGKQKGTGKWTSQNAMDLGIPTPTIDVSVTARQASAFKNLRETGQYLYERDANTGQQYPENLIEMAEQALYSCYILCYSQGFHLLSAASAEYQYNLDMQRIAKIWRGGCIIRAALLEKIRKTYAQAPDNQLLFLSPLLKDEMRESVQGLQDLSKLVNEYAIPGAALAASFHYYLSMTAQRLPMNLVQAQRDYFGSHTYERIDKEGVFHTEWEKLE